VDEELQVHCQEYRVELRSQKKTTGITSAPINMRGVAAGQGSHAVPDDSNGHSVLEKERQEKGREREKRSRAWAPGDTKEAAKCNRLPLHPSSAEKEAIKEQVEHFKNSARRLSHLERGRGKTAAGAD